MAEPSQIQDLLDEDLPWLKINANNDVLRALLPTSAEKAAIGTLPGNFNEGVMDMLSTQLIAGQGIQLSYDDPAGRITIASANPNAATLEGQNGAYYRARSNHTGSQPSSTISDFITAVDAQINDGSLQNHLHYATQVSNWSASSSLVSLIDSRVGSSTGSGVALDHRHYASHVIDFAQAVEDMLFNGKSGGRTISGGLNGQHLTLRSNPLGNGLIFLGTKSVFNDNNERIGLSTTTPTYDVSLGGEQNRVIALERRLVANSSGYNLFVRGGSATVGAVDKNGGSIIIQGGQSTGNATGGAIYFETAEYTGGANNADNPYRRRMVINPNGYIGINQLNPTAWLHIGPSTQLEPGLKLTTGTFPNIPEAGAVDFVGNRFYLTEADATRRFVVQALNANKAAGTPTATGTITIRVGGVDYNVLVQ